MKYRPMFTFVLSLVLALMPVTVRAEPPPPGLTGGVLQDGSASFNGEEEIGGNEAGYSVAIAGDVNGDGYADLLIGAHGYSGSTGRAYLVLGGPGGWQLNENLANADAIYTGEGQTDHAAYSVAGAGDVNGDGYADLLIGAWGYSSDTGRAYLVLGSSDPSSGSPFNLDSKAAAIYTGEDTDNYAGDSVAGAGDVNGDGYADLLIGAYGYSNRTGRAYLVLGSSSPSSIGLGSADAIYTGQGVSNYAGSSVAGAGDVNGDGYDDVLIGAPYYDDGGNQYAGRAYLVLGSSSPSSIGLGSANATYIGESGSNFAGDSVAGAGDVNGDGYADLLIGAYGYSSDIGRAYLVLGYKTVSSIGLGDADAIYTGEDTDNYAGNGVAGAGDVNGDGYADLLIGADGYSSYTGRAYLVLGSSSPSSIGLGSAGAIYTGEGQTHHAGKGLAGAGDVNGDGYSDLLVGAYGYGGSRGRTYLLLSDYDSATAARYRARQKADVMPPVEVGTTGVTVDYTSNAQLGFVYVTRHFRNTCSTNFATNGLLWTVDSMRGSTAEAQFTFKYNNTQIVGWSEGDLKLWYRNRPCQDWTEDIGATLDTDTNRITSSVVTDAHREYTISSSEPDGTAVTLRDFGPQLAKEPPWMVVGLAVLVLLTAAAEWWRQQQRGEALYLALQYRTSAV
jgi:hypothetical protein